MATSSDRHGSLPFDRKDLLACVCDRHGAYTASHLFGTRYTSCPTCSTEEAQQRAAAEAAAQEAAKAARRRAWTTWALATSGLEGRQTRATFDNFNVADQKQGEVLDACRGFAEQFQPPATRGGPIVVPNSSLWLIGKPGTGKSHLGAAMVNSLISRRILARMHSAREIVRLLRSTWNKENPPRRPSLDLTGIGGTIISEEEMIEDIGNVPLLVLDEIGVGFGSDSEHVQLFDVLDLRYKLELPTVLLSNLNVTALKPALGDRVFDRLREGAVVKACTWGSYRGEFAKAGTSQAAEPHGADHLQPQHWWARAGFRSEAEANASYCYAHNAREFHDGHHIGPAAA